MRSSPRKPPRPLDDARLQELALAYVGRFATTRARLANYLTRKLRERGWDGADEPQTASVVERLARMGYIDDAAFAMSKARSLSQRGYGLRRVTTALRQAGVGEDDSRSAEQVSGEQAVAAALRFAQRRRIGPFAGVGPDPREAQRALAAMLRAGHEFALARRIMAMPPDREADLQALVTALSNFDG